MRIGFDLSPLHRPFPPGVVRAVSESVRALRERGQIEVVDLIPPSDTPLRSWRKTLPARVRSENLVGLHSFTSAYPRGGPGKRVQTIHELPWRHGVRENADWRHRYWASLGARGADRILCPTEHVAADLRSTWFAPSSRVRVVPWGVSEAFAEESPLGVVDEVVQPKLTKSEDAFALCLGATREKKNLAALLRGLAKLRERHGPRLQIVVAGEDTPQLRRDLGLASKLGLARWISTPGEVAETDLPAAYRLASVVPVLSFSEGFAFPVLEALKSGTPVLVPANSAQSEIAGEFAITCDPADPESVADGLEQALRERENLRYRLPRRAEEYTWERTAEGIENAWKEIA